MSGLEVLSSMDYPGRFIVLGLTKEGIHTAIYGITGRSSPSQARRLVIKTKSSLGKMPFSIIFKSSSLTPAA